MTQVCNHAISGFIDAYINDNNICFVDGNSGAFINTVLTQTY